MAARLGGGCEEQFGDRPFFSASLPGLSATQFGSRDSEQGGPFSEACSYGLSGWCCYGGSGKYISVGYVHKGGRGRRAVMGRLDSIRGSYMIENFLLGYWNFQRFSTSSRKPCGLSLQLLSFYTHK